MGNEIQSKPDSEICSIMIMFPIDTIEQAIEIKKKISVLLTEVKNARIDFRTTSSVGLIK